MRKIINLYTLLSLIALTYFLSCNKPCENESPRARIVNKGSDTASVLVQTSVGTNTNIDKVPPKYSSDFSSFPLGSGVMTFTIKVGMTSKVITLAGVENCNDYDVNVDATNNVTISHVKRE